jgi:hypothetical protein
MGPHAPKVKRGTFFSTFKAGMLLKTNKSEYGDASDGYYFIENKRLSGIFRQIQSISMKTQDISEKSAADKRKKGDFTLTNCGKMRLRHEFRQLCNASDVSKSQNHGIKPPLRRVHKIPVRAGFVL